MYIHTCIHTYMHTYIHAYIHTYIELTHNFVACSCKLVVHSSRGQSSWEAFPRRLGTTSYNYRRQAVIVSTTTYNHATTDLRLRKIEISVADGRLKVLNISEAIK